MPETVLKKTDVEQLRLYHEASKHHVNAYAPGPGFLDWESQPNPFRRWEGAPRVDLPLVDGLGHASFDALASGELAAAQPDARSLGLFLELALGLSAWKRLGPDRWALRNNPSSGNLHPTEAYLLLWRPLSAELVPGLYHYAPYEHALERRAQFEAQLVEAISRRRAGTFGAIAFSSIVWREAWKYGARALRYCQLDVGHALAAAGYAAAVNGWRLQLDLRPSDAMLSALLGLDRSDDFSGVEPEHPDLVAVLGTERRLGSPDWTLLASSLHHWRGKAGRLSAERVDWPQIAQVLPALCKPACAGTVPHRVADTATQAYPDRGIDAADLIRQRRSVQRMDKTTGIDAASMRRLLSRLVSESSPGLNELPFPPRINLLLFVHRVEGLEPGLYLLERQNSEAFRQALDRDGWGATEWDELPLYRLRVPRDVSRIASRLSCLQAIAGQGAFALAMIASMGQALAEEGAWVWRRLHWEAGLIGQVLYLEAEACGLSGTGIGCFFDDEVLRLLGLPDGPTGPWQVVYHFTVGGALHDERLVTEAPYRHLEGRGETGDAD